MQLHLIQMKQKGAYSCINLNIPWFYNQKADFNSSPHLQIFSNLQNYEAFQEPMILKYDDNP